MIVNYQAVKSRLALNSHDGSHTSVIRDLQEPLQTNSSTILFYSDLGKKMIIFSITDFVKTIFIFATIDSSSFESTIVLDQSAV